MADTASEDTKVNGTPVPNYRTHAGPAKEGAGVSAAVSASRIVVASASGQGGGQASALASVVTQTDASGKPATAAPPPKRASGDADEDGGSVAAPKSGWARFCQCFCSSASTAQEDPYLSAEFDSIDIDYDEVAELRSARPRPLMGPLAEAHRGRKCLVLDLDETLVHSSFNPIPDPDFIIPVEIDGRVHHVYVAKRPGCDEFLERMGKLYEIVVFTASLAKYANPLLDQLDIHKVISTRLFREACVLYQGKYVKDLALMGRDLRQMIIVDNSPCSYLFHPENAIGCESFIEDMSDRELFVMSDFLESIAEVDDVRKWLHGWQGVAYVT